jgi:RNA polymerase sigma-70 factor (ECF subfamily)
MEHTPTRTRQFEAIFDTHHRAILAYALRRTMKREDAADIVADTFLVAWRRLDDMPSGAELLWLYGVARNVLANARRGDRRREQLAENLRRELRSVDMAVAEHPRADEVRSAIAKLARDDRELIQLAYWEDLSPAQIATVLQIPASTVRVRLHRARNALRTTLERTSAPRPHLAVAPTPLHSKETP